MPCVHGVEYLFGVWGVVALSVEQEIDSTLFSCRRPKRQRAMATQHDFHIGQMIKAVFDESGMTVAEFARQIHTARSNVYFIFERRSIDMEQLLDICDALDHNFLDDIQIHRKMKSSLCPRQVHIELNLDDLDDENAIRVGYFLEELKKTKRL